MRSFRAFASALRCRGFATMAVLALTLSPATAQQTFRSDRVALHRLRISHPATADALLQSGGRLVGDYGAFQVIEVDAQAMKSLEGQPGIDVRDDEYHVLLNAGDIDTRSPTAKSREQALRGTFTGKRLRLIHFDGPIKPAWSQDLADAGCQIVTYIPHNTYLVYAESSAFGRAAQRKSAASIAWEGDYLTEDKVHPRARFSTGESKRPGKKDSDLYTIQMVKDADANPDTLGLIDQWRTGDLRRQSEVLVYLNVIAPLPPEAIDLIAARPEVVSITPYIVPTKMDERQDQIVAGNLSGSSPSGPGYLAWLASKGFSQSQFDTSDFLVDLTDSGIDDGTQSPNHFGLYVSGDTGLASRVEYNRLEGTPNSGSTPQGCDGHGNINAHIIGGYNDLTGFPHADSSGYRYGLGVCPFVRVGSSVIFDPDFFTDPDYENLISEAYDDGARISSDSWGADTFGGYDADAQAYDALVRDAQPTGSTIPTAGNQEMTIVFAAGNAGSGLGSVGSPGTAKNVITVGAAENVHSHSTANGGNNTAGNDGCTTPDTEANSADDIATFSSRGPCDDGRTKPEIVAPGTHITGGVAQDSPPPSPTGTGNDLACFEGTGVCALPGGGTAGDPDNFFPSGQQFYSTSSGTSHSTPAVAGGCALVRQYFINQVWPVPSPAMVKAYLMNAARYMTGTSANDDLWSNHQGMGGMDLGTAFDGVVRILRDQVGADKFTASGQSRSVTGVVDDSGRPFRVTLSWTDAPGSTSGDSFNNDLDLTVTISGQVYRGNHFSGAFSTTGGSADFRNNSESVFLPAGAEGSFVVTVTAANINSDGVPNEAPSLDQDYALVIYNATETDQAIVTLDSTTLTAESCGSGNGAVDPDEDVTIDFALRNVGNVDTTNLVATLEATGGVTLPSGAQAYGALVAGGSAATHAFSFTSTGVCGSVVTATLQLQDGAADLGTVTHVFEIGGTLGTTNSEANSATISVPGTGTSGPGSPYPSTIAVSGIAGNAAKVTVRLPSFSHTYPEDVDMLLVGPGGENVILMSAVGGGSSVNNVDLTFDDDAGSSLGAGTITSGTYQPSDALGETQSFDAPAPAGPYGSALQVFENTDPNGTWSLYTFDAADQDSGVLALGWELNVITEESICCASNQPPILAPIGNQSGTISNLIEFSVSATDPYDSDIITLSASNLPSWATFSTESDPGGITNTFSGTPDTAGVFTVTFYAGDKDGVDTEDVDITVSEPSGDCGAIISEYVEDGNDKALEVYNGTASAIDLGAEQYVIQGFHNGSGTAQYTISLTGTLASEDVVVIVYGNASAPLLALADITTGGSEFNFNGNDALVLKSGGASGSVVDSIGQVGDATTYGADVTFVRKPEVLFGDTDTGDAFTPSTEWNALPQGTISELGAHTMDCVAGGGTPPVLVPIGNKSVVESNDLVFAVNAVPTDGDTVTLSVSNPPAGFTFASVDESGMFTWSNATPAGVYTTTFYAVDADGADSEQITITVSEPGSGGGEGILWINEIHYDNSGSDIGEGVELAGPAGTDLSAFKVFAYNGSGGSDYATNSPIGTIDDEGCGYGAVWLPIGGLQNGEPDGVALVQDETNVLEFLSYEGSFVATKGPATGLTSTDIGVTEPGSTPIGASLQLVGTGNQGSDFAWTGPAAGSQGDLNATQTIDPCGGGDGDLDNDGIADAWEDIWCSGDCDPPTDPTGDDDAFSWLEEFLLDYDPTVSNASFAFQSVHFGSFNVTFGETSTGRVYTVDYSEDLPDGSGWNLLQSAVPGSNGLVTVTDPGDATNRSYRIRVHVP